MGGGGGGLEFGILILKLTTKTNKQANKTKQSKTMAAISIIFAL